MASARDTNLENVLIEAAGARCRCMGQCGHNHNWNSKATVQVCGAPHGVNIVRKKDNPSCWRSAPLQGFTNSMVGPRTHERGKYVKDGIECDFAFPELFEIERITQAWLSIQLVNPNKKKRAERYLVMCQFCARHFAANREAS